MKTGTSKGNTVPEGYSDSLRWLDTAFQGQYLPSLSIKVRRHTQRFGKIAATAVSGKMKICYH